MREYWDGFSLVRGAFSNTCVMTDGAHAARQAGGKGKGRVSARAVQHEAG